MLLLALASVLVAFGMWRYSLIALGTDQGRLLFPAIGPLLLLLAVGVASWPWGKLRVWLGTGLVAALALLALYGLGGIVRPAFAPPPPPSAEEIATAAGESSAVSLGELSLIGWTLHDNPILFWHAAQAPTQEWRTNLRVTAADGTLVWEWRRSPGYGRYSTDRWPAATTVRDEYDIQWPEWAGPGLYRVEITLFPFGGQPGEEFPHTLLGWIEKNE
jgi:hypothetical protein